MLRPPSFPPGPLPDERHETPDPVRSGAVDSGFHCVRGYRAQTERNPLIHGKPFLAASNPLADYAELPAARTSPERIEGVSRSLPYSDLLTLTSSHMFFSVMN